MTPNRDQSLQVEHQGNIWRAILPRTISAELEDPLMSMARDAIAGGYMEIVLDFSQTDHADSASIGVLILLLRLVQELEATLAFAGVHGQPQVLLERIGLGQRIRMVEPRGDSPSAPSQNGP
jgi:anti-anti-sigma regulatory factor